jgi:glycerol kinase
MGLLLALDQGTTSTRAMVFTAAGAVVASAQRPLAQHFPRPGWVEHDPEDIWADTVAVLREAVASAGGPARIAALGITNQRETVVVWERASGRPIHRALVWQDRRTAPACAALREAGHEPEVQRRSGLLLDPYFSATKIAWILDAVPGARAAAGRGELACGTIDSFLVWRLSGGRVHVTDATNASRTQLADLRTGEWDEGLLDLFRVPRGLLPRVVDCSGAIATCDASILGGAVPIAGMAGDQQAAAIGQACVEPGMAKATFGTGCFVLVHTGATVPVSRQRLLSTIAWRLGGRCAWALEGSIFNAGTAVQWLRDQLGVIGSADETETLAASLPDNGGVHLVPAFTGLGAPWWDPDARGIITGLTRGSGRAHLARAALEAVAFQCRDLLDACAADGAPVACLRVDGGMARNGWLLRFLADQCGVPVDRPAVTETTALGAALLAGMAVGLVPAVERLAWRGDLRVEPRMSEAERGRLQAAWRRAVERARG